MFITRTTIVAAAAVLMSVSLAHAQKATGVAVVDVQRAFDSLKEKSQIEADLQTQADKVKQEDQERTTKIKELQQDLSILQPGTAAYEKKQEEFERAALDRQVWLNFQQQKLNRERAVRIENIYKKMLNAIGRTATQNGYQIVLFKEPPVQFSNVTKPEQISALIQVRKVLWSADELDLTDQVIQKLDNEFVSGGN